MQHSECTFHLCAQVNAKPAKKRVTVMKPGAAVTAEQ